MPAPHPRKLGVEHPAQPARTKPGHRERHFVNPAHQDEIGVRDGDRLIVHRAPAEPRCYRCCRTTVLSVSPAVQRTDAFERALGLAQYSLHARDEDVFDPIPMRWQLFAVLQLGYEQRAKAVPVRVSASVQVSVSADERLLDRLDAIKNVPFLGALCVHGKHSVSLTPS